MQVINTPYAQFFDIGGTPLSNGSIYIGAVNQNPQTNPIDVFWDAALTQPAAQPLKTLNGSIARDGKIANVYTADSYSIVVKNKSGVLIFSAPDSSLLLNKEFQKVTNYNSARSYNGGCKMIFVEGVSTAFDGGCGFFRLDSSDATSNDDGATVLNATGGGRWKRDFVGDVSSKWFESQNSFQEILSKNRNIFVKESCQIPSTLEIANEVIQGQSPEVSVLSLATSLNTDYGLHFGNYGKLERLAIAHSCTASISDVGRSNCSILFGAKQSSDDSISKGCTVENVKINYTDSNKKSGNTVAGFGNVSYVRINDLDVTTASQTGLQFHWGYSANSLRTNHPRHISVSRYHVIGDVNSTTGFYLSGCHNVTLTDFHIKDCNQGIIIGSGDVGGAKSPQNESVDLVMSNIVIQNGTIENPLNDTMLVNGASYVLGASYDAVYTNQRWIAADYDNTGITFQNLNVIWEAASSNSAMSMLHLRNMLMSNVTVGLKSGFQKVNSTEAITITACTDSEIQIDTHCVVAANLLSGKNVELDVRHLNSDVDNILSQNGISVRGSIKTAVVAEAVPVSAGYIVLSAITCDIHKGMKFEYNGNLYEFAGHARYDTGKPANNTNVKVKIVPPGSGMAIPAGATIEQYYCIHDSKIKGRISGSNKGIKIVSSDARVPFDIEIDCEFEKNVACDIEVPLGIPIKYKGVYYYNDNLGTMTIKDGVAAQTTVISYSVANGRKTGNATAIPSNGMWSKGDILFNRNVAAGGSQGWECTTAGAGSSIAWQPSTAYSVGNRRYNGTRVYNCIAAGISAASGGPTGTGSGIADGTAVWQYVADKAVWSNLPTLS